MEENNVHIVDWPKEQEALLSHRFPEPVEVTMTNAVQNPFFVNMNMNMGGQAEQPIPVCIKICEPICAESNYRIGINLMGQPFAEIVVRGITRLFNCKDKPAGNKDDIPAAGPGIVVK